MFLKQEEGWCFVSTISKKLRKLNHGKSKRLLDMVPFAQVKKCEKHPWRSVISIMGVFHIFLNCTNGTKLSKTSQMFEKIY